MESESDILSSVPAGETPSSSPSAAGSPRVELVMNDDDPDFGGQSPPVAIIGEDDIYGDPMLSFPYAHHTESLLNTTKRLVTFLREGIYPCLPIVDLLR